MKKIVALCFVIWMSTVANLWASPAVISGETQAADLSTLSRAKAAMNDAYQKVVNKTAAIQKQKEELSDTLNGLRVQQNAYQAEMAQLNRQMWPTVESARRKQELLVLMNNISPDLQRTQITLMGLSSGTDAELLSLEASYRNVREEWGKLFQKITGNTPPPFTGDYTTPPPDIDAQVGPTGQPIAGSPFATADAKYAAGDKQGAAKDYLMALNPFLNTVGFLSGSVPTSNLDQGTLQKIAVRLQEGNLDSNYQVPDRISKIITVMVNRAQNYNEMIAICSFIRDQLKQPDAALTTYRNFALPMLNGELVAQGAGYVQISKPGVFPALLQEGDKMSVAGNKPEAAAAYGAYLNHLVQSGIRTDVQNVPTTPGFPGRGNILSYIPAERVVEIVTTLYEGGEAYWANTVALAKAQLGPESTARQLFELALKYQPNVNGTWELIYQTSVLPNTNPLTEARNMAQKGMFNVAVVALNEAVSRAGKDLMFAYQTGRDPNAYYDQMIQTAAVASEIGVKDNARDILASVVKEMEKRELQQLSRNDSWNINATPPSLEDLRNRANGAYAAAQQEILKRMRQFVQDENILREMASFVNVQLPAKQDEPPVGPVKPPAEIGPVVGDSPTAPASAPQAVRDQLARANAAFAKGDYEVALQAYMMAYGGALKSGANHVITGTYLDSKALVEIATRILAGNVPNSNPKDTARMFFSDAMQYAGSKTNQEALLKAIREKTRDDVLTNALATQFGLAVPSQDTGSSASPPNPVAPPNPIPPVGPTPPPTGPTPPPIGPTPPPVGPMPPPNPIPPGDLMTPPAGDGPSTPPVGTGGGSSTGGGGITGRDLILLAPGLKPTMRSSPSFPQPQTSLTVPVQPLTAKPPVVSVPPVEPAKPKPSKPPVTMPPAQPANVGKPQIPAPLVSADLEKFQNLVAQAKALVAKGQGSRYEAAIKFVAVIEMVRAKSGGLTADTKEVRDVLPIAAAAFKTAGYIKYAVDTYGMMLQQAQTSAERKKIIASIPTEWRQMDPNDMANDAIAALARFDAMVKELNKPNAAAITKDPVIKPIPLAPAQPVGPAPLPGKEVKPKITNKPALPVFPVSTKPAVQLTGTSKPISAPVVLTPLVDKKVVESPVTKTTVTATPTSSPVKNMPSVKVPPTVPVKTVVPVSPVTPWQPPAPGHKVPPIGPIQQVKSSNLPPGAKVPPTVPVETVVPKAAPNPPPKTPQEALKMAQQEYLKASADLLHVQQTVKNSAVLQKLQEERIKAYRNFQEVDKQVKEGTWKPPQQNSQMQPAAQRALDAALRENAQRKAAITKEATQPPKRNENLLIQR